MVSCLQWGMMELSSPVSASGLGVGDECGVVIDVAVAAPKVGVTKVGLFENTKLPVPVSSVIAVAKFELVGVARKL